MRIDCWVAGKSTALARKGRSFSKLNMNAQLRHTHVPRMSTCETGLVTALSQPVECGHAPVCSVKLSCQLTGEPHRRNCSIHWYMTSLSSPVCYVWEAKHISAGMVPRRLFAIVATQSFTSDFQFAGGGIGVRRLTL